MSGFFEWFSCAGLIALALFLSRTNAVLAESVSSGGENAVSEDTRNTLQQIPGIRAGDLIYLGTEPGNDQNDGTTAEAVPWKVLDPETMLLLSEKVLGKKEGPVCFDGESPCTNIWKDSDAKAWCDAFFENALTETEKGVVLSVTRSDSAYESGGDSEEKVHFDAVEKILDGDRIYFLSAEEVETFLPEKESRIGSFEGTPSAWWLRSPMEKPADQNLRYPVAGAVMGQESAALQGAREEMNRALGIIARPIEEGSIVSINVNNTYADVGARPALNLDPSDILFASPVQGGKTGESGETEVTGLQMIQDQDAHEWKLTIQDPTVAVTFEETDRDGSSVTVSYRDAAAAEDAFISAAVLTDAGLLSAYGRLSRVENESGSVTIDLSGISVSETDHLFLFLEQVHGAYETDYAGGWTEISTGKDSVT